MKKVLALIVCLLFALSVTAVFAADKAMDTKAPAAADEKKMDEKKMADDKKAASEKKAEKKVKKAKKKAAVKKADEKKDA